jgi:triosephosphate isomerase
MQTLIAGNWKMHKTAAEALELIDGLLARSAEFPAGVDVMVAPPFTALQAVSQRLNSHHRIKLGAQTMHWENHGAFTGEISPPMLEEFGCEYVILGHSERRAFCGETNQYVRLKVRAALAHGITPIVAVGETLEEKDRGLTKEKVVTQTLEALTGLAEEQIRRVVLAYEPIWAIGTGKNDDPENANATMGEIRGCMQTLHDIPILYGGSVKAENMAAYAAMSNINGALVGGASLQAQSFAGIISAAAAAR